MNKEELSTEEQRANLMILAEFLDGLEAPQFYMGSFSMRPCYDGSVMKYYPGAHTCGTVCCAVGWAPAALGLPEKDLLGMTWDEVSDKYLGLSYEETDVVYEDLGVTEWDLLFGDEWAGYESFPEQAADRIRKYINQGPQAIEPTPWMED